MAGRLVGKENNIPDEITTVADLIDNEIGCWKIYMVRRNFVAPEADAILNIPLRREGGEDLHMRS